VTTVNVSAGYNYFEIPTRIYIPSANDSKTTSLMFIETMGTSLVMMDSKIAGCEYYFYREDQSLYQMSAASGCVYFQANATLPEYRSAIVLNRVYKWQAAFNLTVRAMETQIYTRFVTKVYNSKLRLWGFKLLFGKNKANLS
jgi:hypothetical protein